MAHKLDANEIESIHIDSLGEVVMGMKVEHPNFGIGEVEAIFKFVKSGENTIRINFESHGSKSLVPEFARLSLPKTKTAKNSFFSSLFKGGSE
jgi:hypothetical protein